MRLCQRLHEKTGVLLGIGQGVRYAEGGLSPQETRREKSYYSIYNKLTHTWSKAQVPLLPNGKEMDCPLGFGCAKRFDLPDGDILLPSYVRNALGDEHRHVIVYRFSFDGRHLVYKSESEPLYLQNEARGLLEPSITFWEGKYYLTLRAETAGFVSVSDDGVHFTPPMVWRWDNGFTVPTYNTQQNWLCCRDGLFLVYTRKNGKNDHVFRHRAPLYLCKVDTKNLTLLRNTEIALTPERGARMGNFGVTYLSMEKSLVVTTEWMQPVGCEKYDSNNATFMVEVTC